MRYSIVIPTYNHCNDFLKPCIESIIKYTRLTDIELIVVANGCKDETEQYLRYIKSFFKNKNLNDNFKYIIRGQPLGYAKSTNLGIKESSCKKIILLNNDIVLLPQNQNAWIEQLEMPFIKNSKCGISSIHKMWSSIVNRHFAAFFCVMIDRNVFDVIGLLNEEYEIGMCEDVEFCIEAENKGFDVLLCTETRSSENINTGNFPIYHHGNGTLNDKELVTDATGVWFQNCLRMAKKYNPSWYEYAKDHKL